MNKFHFSKATALLAILFAQAFWVPAQSVQWSFPTPDIIVASPAVASDGTVYAPAYENIFALTSEGDKKWAFPPEGSTTFPDFFASPSVGLDGTIYAAGARNGILYALAPENGSVRWTFSISSDQQNNGAVFYSSPALARDGTIFIGGYKIQNANTSYLYALNTNGTRRWRYAVPAGIYGSAVISQDSATVYFGCDDRNLYALNTNGSLRWTFNAGAVITTSPAIGKDGAIYFGSTSASHMFYALNPDGSQRWAYNLTNASASVNSSPAISSDGTIYFGSNDRRLYALNPNGTLKWTALCGGIVDSSPAIDANGNVYVGCKDGTLYAFASMGSNLWTLVTGGYVSSSPAIDASGTLYIGSADRKLYAISGPAALAETAWPMFRHDIRHTAQAHPFTNTLPAISDIPDQTNKVNTQIGPLALHISDFETSAEDLVVTAKSSNPELIQNSSITVSGVSSNRFVTLSPEPDAAGTALIAITVTDLDGGINSNSFLVTVLAANHSPIIAPIPDQTILEQTLLVMTNLVSDADAPSQVLSWTLLEGPGGSSLDPESGIFRWMPGELDGPGTNRVIISVTDNGFPPLSATQSFVVVVEEVNTAPTIALLASRSVHAGAALQIPVVASDLDSPANSLEFALETAPLGASIDSQSGQLRWTASTESGATHLFLVTVADDGVPPMTATNTIFVTVEAPPQLVVSLDIENVMLGWTSIPESTYRVQYRTNLMQGDWLDLTDDVVATGPTSASAIPIPTDTQGFYRVRVMP